MIEMFLPSLPLVRRGWFANHALQRTAAPLFRSERGGNSRVPRALHRSCRRLSLSLGLGRMRTRIAILFALLAIAITCCVSCSSNRAWPPKGYTEVRAFLYNLDSDDSLACVTNGRLDASMTDTNGVRLTDVQTSRFLAAVTGTHPEHAVAGCYVPHHAYVFYDQQHRIVGWVELCFGCLNYRASFRSRSGTFIISGIIARLD